jgi:hypothetical protein
MGPAFTQEEAPSENENLQEVFGAEAESKSISSILISLLKSSKRKLCQGSNPDRVPYISYPSCESVVSSHHPSFPLQSSPSDKPCLGMFTKSCY